MYLPLLKFEWQFIHKKKTVYAMILFFLGFGIMAGMAANFSFPNTYYNGTYVLYYLIGIASLLAIFSTTLLSAQTLFREKETRFEGILYATPIHKIPYVLSRFSIIFFVNAVCYFLLIMGLMAGHVLRARGNENFGDFSWIHYLHPYLTLLLPNILFCTAVACSIGLFTKNKMLVYVSGVFVYFLYWGVSMFTNSPLIANSAPVDESTLQRAALLDPFGLAAFLQQTQHWSALQRNIELINLSGNLLINRLIYLTFSFVLLFLAYRKFKFNVHQEIEKNKYKAEPDKLIFSGYKWFSTVTNTWKYDLNCLISLFKIESKNILRSIPIWLVLLGWIGFFGIETMSDIGGNSRIPEFNASTGIMVKNILSSLPVIAWMVLLFYGYEIYWRSHRSRFLALENTTAIKPTVILLSKWLSLLIIPFLLILASVLTGLSIQFIKGYTMINWELYAELIYLIGLPLAITSGLIIFLQDVFKNGYLAIVISGIFLLLTNTSFGKIIGIKHPLLKFAQVYQGAYSDMNGFGLDRSGFDLLMVYWLCFIVILFLGFTIVGRRSPEFNKSRWIVTGTLILLSISGLIISGIDIYKQTEIINKDKLNDWKQNYEAEYAHLKSRPQPVIKEVKTWIELYPSASRYAVKGNYVLLNKYQSPIDTLYIQLDKSMSWDSVQLANSLLIKKDTEFGYLIFKPDQGLKPGDSLTLSFNFSFQASPFNPSAGYNTIIGIGSFIRISRFYPVPGYNAEYEIEDVRERKRRNMALRDSLTLLSAPKRNPEFIHLDATISTEENQIAIGIGELQNQWTASNRSFFHYKTESLVPFRFAVASAKYFIKKQEHRGKSIEIYYHPQHGQNVDHILKTAKQSLEYYETNFAPYPFKAIRFIEISSLTKGFAGTAYPGSLFINESFGFQNKLEDHPEKDILNEMVSHELSHMWWGNSKIAPGDRQGSIILTETLAMYSELMIYKKVYGEDYLLSRVNVHKSIYLNERSISQEQPLYLASPDQSHLAYDKGMVVMYQLFLLLGEEKINQVLQQFYNKFSFPLELPVSTDLLNEFYHMASPSDSIRINELFQKIITYDILLDEANSIKKDTGTYELQLQATINKYEEDGQGIYTDLKFNDGMNALIVFVDHSSEQILLQVIDGKIDQLLNFNQKPIRVILDPKGKLLSRSDESKEKQVHQMN